MEGLQSATLKAIQLLLTADPTLWSIIGLSFTVSLKALFIALPFAFIIAFCLSFYRFPGRRLAISFFNTALSIPAVVVGLTLYLMLSRVGPLGDFRLLFTQQAMIIGQIVLGFPILVAMGHAALQAVDRRAMETAITLGATPLRAAITVLGEARFGLIAAAVAAFGRIIAEVGCSMMVGGNILDYTRNIPTAIALETSKGEFSQGIALGIVLLLMALLLNFSLGYFQGRGEATL